ncbi:hypothetical protein CP532_0840 [Ophiocordyceps camponoti-leonardi (nom. inval.)]|nr:hypothetical protein CP532_0840 [Ophiocordyceps camponoti-leonardi (nom. inval.)]
MILLVPKQKTVYLVFSSGDVGKQEVNVMLIKQSCVDAPHFIACLGEDKERLEGERKKLLDVLHHIKNLYIFCTSRRELTIAKAMDDISPVSKYSFAENNLTAERYVLDGDRY